MVIYASDNRSISFDTSDSILPDTSFFNWGEALYLPSANVFHSPTQEEIAEVIKTAVKLTKIRQLVGKPIKVSCWVRPNKVNAPGTDWHGKDYNAFVNGAKSSCHIKGQAVDFQVVGMTVDEFYTFMKGKWTQVELAAENNGSKQGRNWIHVQNKKVKAGWAVFNP